MANARPKAATRKVKKKASRRTRAKRSAVGPLRAGPRLASRRRATTADGTLETLVAKIDALAGQIAELKVLLQASHHEPPQSRHHPTRRSRRSEIDRRAMDESRFDDELTAIVAEIDRSARHAGMVPIPDVRNAFIERGWSRRAFDERLLQAERDFIVDLKAANDPSRLVDPTLAIEEPGRGYLQYVVTR